MQKITDWLELWRQLVEVREKGFASEQPGQEEQDRWRERARGFHKKVLERWARPDSSRDFLLSQLDSNTSVLDIGAGTGSWTVLMARAGAQVTALDPSLAMIEVLKENLVAEGLQENATVIQGSWPDADVPVHDITLCAHAMYGAADLALFIRRLEEVTRKRCFLLLRAPVPDNVMAIAAQRIWGQPHDSPNFVVCYNALIQMGIYPNVLMENTGAWGAWSNETMEDAFAEIKGKLGLKESTEHDDFLRGLLKERLTYRDGRWVWPPSMRSALVYWDVERR
ncbi:MAG: class I SAM-dependent methyltransferase [Anaerolineae bacterium]|jgi:SAM-dependent methyltransferase